ncbi:hypothetical protein NCS52_01575700 [Fusarium sp. LHS14.1]|nr:hypothetical protein NCS52_01575700 [Fusarium sp. LHS14.1]
MASDQLRCQAIPIGSTERCCEEATNANGLFCWRHAKQVHALYTGYEKRNARLNALDDEAPDYMKESEVPLANDTFKYLDDDRALKAIHSHLYEKFILLGQVIEARNIHHKHFYSIKEEEAAREKEHKKVKQEAALFRRHWKKLEARLERARQREEQERQDAFLEAAYRERMELDEEAWDPILDVNLDNRNRYIDLIKHFLWMELLEADEGTGLEEKTGGLDLAEKAKTKTKAKVGSSRASSSNAGGHDSADLIHKRGQRKLLAITLENPYETYEKTALMTNDEIELVVKDIREIKLLLFCRLLLARASMLPAALRANSMEEFLNDTEITESDLRDLYLKVEAPSLQDIRDACADFARGDEADDDDDATDEEEDDDDETFEELITTTDDIAAFIRATVQIQIQITEEDKGYDLWQEHLEPRQREGHEKDCDLKHAIQLCRNWSEFSDLDLLTLWQYFPASNWASWGNNKLIQQLQELEFFPYFVDFDAEQNTRRS